VNQLRQDHFFQLAVPTVDFHRHIASTSLPGAARTSTNTLGAFDNRIGRGFGLASQAWPQRERRGAGPDGNIWFTNIEYRQICHITP
jgi:hypothetical protein